MRTPITPSLCMLVVFCALAASPAQTQAQPPASTALTSESSPLAKYEGQTVSNIEFRGVTSADTATLRSLLAQKTGEPLDPEKLRASIKALYATGRFATLNVEADRNARGELILIFDVTENYFNGAINVNGTPQKTDPKPNQLIASSQIDLGDVFSEDKVVGSIDRMKKIFADNGYYEATVTYTLDPNPKDSQMAIHFHATPGPLALVGDVTIRGDAGIAPEQVRSLTKLKEGAKVSSQRVTRALERMRKHYQKNAHLEAQVSLVGRQYHPETNRLDYVFEVDQGPTVSITTEGQGISKSQLQKLVPVYQENSVDDDLLNEGRRNMRDYLQTRGYFDATVAVERHPVEEQNHLNIVYIVDPGIRHKLVSIVVQGNKYFNTATIRERMQVEPSTVLIPNGHFSQRMLTEDISGIKLLYQANGFLNVQVNGDLVDNYQGKKNEMQVVIKVDEGPQTLVNALKVEGAATYTAAALEQSLSNVPGQPFSEANVVSDRDSLTYFYYDRGFPNVQFESTTVPVPGNPPRMNVLYQITEGQRVFVNRVLITGLNHTRPYIVNRQMRIQDGDPLSQNR
ncbi:MAG: POTRA domain-containing protein, partial [Terracidiphilus sp.]